MPERIWNFDQATHSSFEDKNLPANDADGVVAGVAFVRFVVFGRRRCPPVPRPLRVRCSDGDGRGGDGGGSSGGRRRSGSGSSGGGSSSGSGVMFVRFVRPLRSIFRPFRLLREAIWLGWPCSPRPVGRANACRRCPGRCRSFRRCRATW